MSRTFRLTWLALALPMLSGAFAPPQTQSPRACDYLSAAEASQASGLRLTSASYSTPLGCLFKGPDSAKVLLFVGNTRNTVKDIKTLLTMQHRAFEEVVLPEAGTSLQTFVGAPSGPAYRGVEIITVKNRMSLTAQVYTKRGARPDATAAQAILRLVAAKVKTPGTTKSPP